MVATLNMWAGTRGIEARRVGPSPDPPLHEACAAPSRVRLVVKGWEYCIAIEGSP